MSEQQRRYSKLVQGGIAASSVLPLTSRGLGAISIRKDGYV